MTDLRPTLILILACLVLPASFAQQAEPSGDNGPKLLDPDVTPTLDRTGKPRQGKASYYADEFAGRKMADGSLMDPESNIAASRTLPIGTRAKVTNLENGKSAVVEIRDRGPYVEGRIVDVSPSVAERLDMKEKGVAHVEVAPIAVPQRDGSVRRAQALRTGANK